MSFFSLFRKSHGPKNGGGIRMARELHGKTIRYVTERRNGNDDVIGRGGNLSLHGDTFLVYSSGEVLFRIPASELSAGYLLSGDGVVITLPDPEHPETPRTIVVHFVYYRK